MALIAQLRRAFGRPVLTTGRWAPVSDVSTAMHGDRSVLLDERRGRYYSLDPVASRIWDLLVAGATIPEIVATLSGEYDTTEEQLRADATALVTALSARGLVRAL